MCLFKYIFTVFIGVFEFALGSHLLVSNPGVTPGSAHSNHSRWDLGHQRGCGVESGALSAIVLSQAQYCRFHFIIFVYFQFGGHTVDVQRGHC